MSISALKSRPEVNVMSNVVRIDFNASGGLVPRFKFFSAELGVLPEGEAEKLRGLIEASGILTMSPGRHTTGAEDAPEYTISIETREDGPRTVTFDAPSVPASARPLIQALLARSRDWLDMPTAGG